MPELSANDLVELQNIIKKADAESEKAKRTFYDAMDSTINSMIKTMIPVNSNDYLYYLELGKFIALEIFTKNWDSTKANGNFKAYFWVSIKPKIKEEIRQSYYERSEKYTQKGKTKTTISTDYSGKTDGAECSFSIGNLLEDYNLSPGEAYSASVLKKGLEKGFNNLPERTQIILIGRFLLDQTFTKISELIGIDRTNVARDMKECGLKPLRKTIIQFFEENDLKYDEKIALDALRHFLIERGDINEN